MKSGMCYICLLDGVHQQFLIIMIAVMSVGDCLFRYKKVIAACALQPDLEQLPNADLTEIGEKVR